MKLIEPSTVFHSSVNDIQVNIPHAAVISDGTSFQNQISLLYLIKDYDSKLWLRGEVFGSAIFFMNSV